MQYRITTPVPGFTGVSAGANFTNGVAEVDDADNAPALAYFRSQGYGVEEIEPEPETPARRKATPKGADQ
ncbi:hypothetical protein ACH44C_33590 [Streptomyces purpureus]|uniref:hypothetical protein n=1 Tax=Streptomyces purpureus TaxID=1951 RepID=UPI0037A792F9